MGVHGLAGGVCLRGDSKGDTANSNCGSGGLPGAHEGEGAHGPLARCLYLCVSCFLETSCQANAPPGRATLDGGAARPAASSTPRSQQPHAAASAAAGIAAVPAQGFTPHAPRRGASCQCQQVWTAGRSPSPPFPLRQWGSDTCGRVTFGHYCYTQHPGQSPSPPCPLQNDKGWVHGWL